MTKYGKVGSGEEVTINYKDAVLSVACCDCGLVHHMVFKVKRGSRLGITFYRNNRSTAQLRRHKYGNLQNADSSLKYKMERKDAPIKS